MKAHKKCNNSAPELHVATTDSLQLERHRSHRHHWQN